MTAPNQLVTRKQLTMLLGIWECDEKIPGRGKKLIIQFPPGNDIRVIEVEPTDKKGTYGDKLFSLTYSNGRLAVTP